MIKAEEFENGIFLAITNNVEALNHFSIGLGGRSVALVKVQGIFWLPLSKDGFLEPKIEDAKNKMKEAKSVAECLQIAKENGIVWIGGSA